MGITNPGSTLSVNDAEGGLYGTGKYGYSSDSSTVAYSGTSFSGGSDDLVSTLGDVSAALKDALRKLPEIDNQVGAIFFNDNKILGMDVFDLPDSWSSIKEDIP